MKKVIRMCESELHELVGNAARKVIKEMDETALISEIAKKILEKRNVNAKEGENDLEVMLDNGTPVYINYEIIDHTVIRRDRWSENPNDEIVDDDYELYVYDIDVNEELHSDIDDIVKNALLKVVSVEHTTFEDDLDDYYELDDEEPEGYDY